MSTEKPIKVEDLESLIEIFNRSDWDEMHLEADGLEVFLSNNPNATGPRHAVAPAPAPAIAAVPVTVSALAGAAAAPQATSAAASLPPGMAGVHAPNLGTFYRAPKPGAAPYVEIGQRVEVDTEVCLIEVMKLFTPVRAGVKGIVRSVEVNDGQMVEYEQLLLVIEPIT